MTNISKGRKDSAKLKSMGNQEEYLNRITKSLYYAKLPVTDCLSLPVTEIAAELFTEVKNGKTLERLDVEEASRISRNACVSPCSLVLALLYLERLKDCNPEYLQQVVPSELFLVSLMVASKFLNDDGEEDEVFNTEWAQSGDISLSQINKLEKDFLQAIDWAVFVRDNEFWERLQKLEKDIAYKEAQKRGWFSYTELNCLMNTVQLLDVANTVINVSSICLATYAAGIVTLLGSAIVTSHLPGTILTPQKPTINNTKMEFTAVMHKKSPIMDFETNDALIVTEGDNMVQCNESCIDCENIAHDSEETPAGWKWWLNSIMTWLPQYSALESDTKLVFDSIKLENTGTFTTNTKLLFDTQSLAITKDKPALQINWKEILGQDVQPTIRGWRHYANYITKCF